MSRCVAVQGLVSILMVLIMLCVQGQLLNRQNEEDTEYQEYVINVVLEKVEIIYSVDYPRCCTPATYRITYASEQTIIGLQLLFEELNIPPDSLLQVYDGFSSDAPPLSPLPRYVKGGWTRPFLTSTGSSIFIKFNPGNTGTKTYTGFKAQVTVDAVGQTLDVPYTDCPRSRDPMDGGRVQLDPVTIPWARVVYRFDCVWQIHPTVEGFHVFMHIDSMDLVDGTASIHNDSYADSAVLQQYVHVDTRGENELDTSIQQPPGGFTSPSGIYIRMNKPTDEGHFHFTYGLFKPVNEDSGEDCELRVGAVTMPGYHCPHSIRCILKVHRCNELVDCPNGEDEDQAYCANRPSTTPAPPVASTPCPKSCQDGTCIPIFWLCPEEQGDGAECSGGMQRCDDGMCVYSLSSCPGQCRSNEKKCANGDCVNAIYEECSEDCARSEKRCNDGTCVQTYERCPEEGCPSYKPNRCSYDDDCYYDYDRCDGSSDCMDGSDEYNCPQSSSNSGKLILVVVVIPFVVLVLVCAFCMRKKNQTARGRRTNMSAAQGENATQMQPIVSGTQPMSEAEIAASRQYNFSDPSGPGSNGGYAPGQTDPPVFRPDAPPPSYDEAIASAPPADQVLPSYSEVSHITTPSAEGSSNV